MTILSLNQWDRWDRWVTEDDEPGEWVCVAPDPDEARQYAFETLSRMMTEDEAMEIVAKAGDDLDHLSYRVSDIDRGYWRGAIKVNGRWISAYPELARRETRLTAFMEQHGLTTREQALDALLDAYEATQAARLNLVTVLPLGTKGHQPRADGLLLPGTVAEA